MSESASIVDAFATGAPVVHGDWVAVVERRTDVVRADALANLHDLLDRAGPPPTSVPLLWHWVAFTPRARQDDLGPDGHPRTGTFLPPMPGYRRMFAGATVIRRGCIAADEPVEQVSKVTSVQSKTGRSGKMFFVTVKHIFAGRRGLIEEIDTLVYREPSEMLTLEKPDPTQWTWRRPVAIDPTLLFRFSALTYNAHRIHYDRTYATQVEGYPGLVVHGPLQAVLLADLAERHSPRAALSSITFRATSPAFDNGIYEVCGKPTPDHVDLAAHSDGVTTMVATVTTEASR